MIELVQMWALVEILGIVCLPLTFIMFRNLPDRGWALSKSLGIIIIAFAVWLPLMCLQFLPFSQLFIAGIVLILAAGGILGFTKMHRAIREMWQSNRTYVIATEMVFAGMLLLLGWLRTLKPDIHGFEMFMDEGFVASIMRSTHFPPNDMWLSGYSINYYYYAHYTIALLAKLLGQSPAVAFNTGIALFFGLTALNLFSVTCNIVAWGRYEYTKMQHLVGGAEGSRVLPALLPAIPYGLTSMLMGLILGNLAATQQWWQNHGNSSHFDWFAPSRVIKDTINEFPAFSFVLSCFHAHVLTLAFTILCIGLAFNLLLEPEGRGLSIFGEGWYRAINICVAAIVLGSLFVMNGWDYPTYMGLTCVCIGLQQLLVHRLQLRVALLLDIALVVGSLIALLYIFYLPFYVSFVSPSQGIGLVSPIYHSRLSDELLIYGLFIFVFVSLLIVSTVKHSVAEAVQEVEAIPVPVAVGARFLSRDEHSSAPFDSQETTGLAVEHEQKQSENNPAQLEKMVVEKRGFGSLLSNQIAMRVLLLCVGGYLLVSLAILIFIPSYATLASGCCIAVTGAILVLYHIRNRSQAFALLLGASAFLIIAGCEVFFLKDVFSGGSALRMNTVFKFYFQAWSLLSVSSGAGLFFIWKRFRSWRVARISTRWTRHSAIAIWSLCLLLLVLASMVYPLLAPYARYAHTDASGAQPAKLTDLSLDGAVYLATCRPPDCDFVTAGDYKAIRWLNEHVEGSPVIVEGSGDDYGYSSRISTFTGLPTVMGWTGHEVQWRVNWVKQSREKQEDFDSRGASIETIYTDPHPAVVLTTMARYNARYVYVGALERKKYAQINLKRFEGFMRRVYDADGVTIFQIK